MRTPLVALVLSVGCASAGQITDGNVPPRSWMVGCFQILGAEATVPAWAIRLLREPIDQSPGETYRKVVQPSNPTGALRLGWWYPLQNGIVHISLAYGGFNSWEFTLHRAAVGLEGHAQMFTDSTEKGTDPIVVTLRRQQCP
jgi:hypothetical protein